VVGGVFAGVRWSGGRIVVPREVRCPDDDVGRVAEANKAGAARVGGREIEEGSKRGIREANSN
jgi:hypothetical protein